MIASWLMLSNEAPRTTRIQDLTAALRVYAKGLLRGQATVELLIGHENWLRRDDFVAEFVETDQEPEGVTPMAFVDWKAVAALDAGQLPCSGS